MYAVIRAGGKQYRVAPGDVVRVEKLSPEGDQVEFNDVVVVSAEEGKLTRPTGNGVRVLGRVMEQGRGDKILVFHFKRKKQYKKLRGHRQDFTAVRIESIDVDGKTFSAPALPAKRVKEAVNKAVAAAAMLAGAAMEAASQARGAVKQAAPKKSATKNKKKKSTGTKAPAKKTAAKKSTPKKSAPKKK